MIKVFKRAPRGWKGNGFGYDCATWVVAADPSITIAKAGFNWVATQDGERIARGYDKAMVLEALAEKRPELVEDKA